MDNDPSAIQHRRARDLGPLDGREYVGEVSVDGAELLIVDPVYLPGRCDHLDDELHSDPPWYGYGREVLRNTGLPSQRLAVLLRLESDGAYPVWAEYTKDGKVLRYTIEVALPEEPTTVASSM